MNQIPSYIIGGNFISLVHNYTIYNITEGDARFPAVLQILKDKSWDQLEDTLSLPKLIAKFSLGSITVYENAIFYRAKQVKNIVCEKILEFMSQDYPFESLVAFLDKLMSNPSSYSVDQLYTYLEKYKLPICQDGDFLAMKSVNLNWTDHHTGKISNHVGACNSMDRSKISEDYNLGCHVGFHVGSEQFVNTLFGGDNRRIILCKINPRDVVCIPLESAYQKMRVCAYSVVKELDEQFHGINFNSDYAEDTFHVDPEVPLIKSKYSKRDKYGRFVKGRK